MAATDADICNLALLRIGELKQVTFPVASDTSTAGKVCAVAYPAALSALLQRFPWRFASKGVQLYEDGLLTAYLQTPTYSCPGWQFVYALPTDMALARYIYDGQRPGQPAFPLAVGDVSGVTTVSQLPAINGVAPLVPFKVDGSFLFTDYTDPTGAPAWSSTATYLSAQVVSYGGKAYVSKQGANTNQQPDTATAFWAATNTAQLVYTQKVTDVTKMPQVFVEALAWLLAVDLALGLTGKPDLASALQGQADIALRRALAAEGTGQRPDMRPDSSFISVRG